MHKRMSFKELLQQDAKNVFLNPAEFGEECMVNGREMTVVIDNNELLERQQTGQPKDGAYMGRKLVYVAAEDFGPPPKQGSAFRLDKKEYRVADVVSEEGIYSITIEANKAR